MIAGTCELLTFFMLHSNVLNPETKSKPQLLSTYVMFVTISVLNREDEWEQDCSESGRRHHCLPPVSPYRCRRQAVLDLLFDDVWWQLVGWMKELVQRHWECCTSSMAEFNLTYINKCPSLFTVFRSDCMCDWQMMKRFLGT